MDNPVAIEVDGLSRSFGPVDALRDVSFEIAAGSAVALLGVNGAGKTTLTKILATLLLPGSGRARVLGHDVVTATPAVRRSISVVLGGDRGLYGRLSGADNLRFFGMLSGLGRAELRERSPAALDRVGLTDAAGRRVETYSKGMRQRLHLAIGLISEPRVLLLDEPTVGLDPIEAERLRSTVAALRDGGTTVLLTSHHLLDVERLASRVLLLDRGRLRSDTSVADFAARAGYAAVVVLRVRGRRPDLDRALPPGVTVDDVRAEGGDWLLTLRLASWGGGMLARLGAVTGLLDVVDVQVRPATLEEAFARVSADRAA